jgi:hypothetical protein
MNSFHVCVGKSRTAKPVGCGSMLGKVERCASDRLKREDRYCAISRDTITFLDDYHGLVIVMGKVAMEYCAL